MRLVLHDYWVDFKNFGTKIYPLFEISSFLCVLVSSASMERRLDVNKNSNIADVKEQLKNIFINIDKFDIEKFNTNYSARAVSKKLNIT